MAAHVHRCARPFEFDRSEPRVRDAPWRVLDHTNAFDAGELSCVQGSESPLASEDLVESAELGDADRCAGAREAVVEANFTVDVAVDRLARLVGEVASALRQ